MKFSEYTLTVLKNFATINPSIVLRKGTMQKTMSPDKRILVEVELQEDFPNEFGIYELNQFLGNVTTLKSPELTFNEKSVLLQDDNLKINYYSCSPNLIPSPPNKELVLDRIDGKFDLPNASLQKLLRLGLMNELKTLSIVGKNGELTAVVHNRQDDTSNSGTCKLADYDGADFTASFSTENIKLIPDDYDVEVKNNAFAKFTSKTNKLRYFIAVEAV